MSALGQLIDIVKDACAHDRRLNITGGNSKEFLGCIDPDAEILDTRGVSGIVSYEPEELVIRARGGTLLEEVESALAASGQMLPFEPPRFGGQPTLGGAVATGIAGPRRPWAGAVRDFVLGMEVVTGDGRHVSFGGQVMKNVAGYDIARLATGAMGTLGVIVEVSLKVLPRPATETTVVLDSTVAEANATVLTLGSKPLPLSGTCYHDGRLYIRLSGSESAVNQAVRVIGGDQTDNAIWSQVANHELPVLASARELWRVSVPPASEALLDEAAVVEWGGGQRWIVDPPFDPRQGLEGHATLYRGGVPGVSVFHPLPPLLAKIHRGIKSRFDPRGLLNPGRMYEDF